MFPLARRPSAHPEALEQLLRSGTVQRADIAPPADPRPLSTGVPALDRALGGGLVRGRIHEIVAPLSSGGTALLRAALGVATRAGELCALIDPADAFDPRPNDIDLRRLLWVKPHHPAQALRAAEIAAEARFGLVALDLGDLGSAPSKPPRGQRLVRFGKRASSPNAAGWARVARRAEKHGSAILVLSRAPQGGTFAAATVALERGAARWEGKRGAPGRLLGGISAVGAVARGKRIPPSGPLPILLPWEERE